jgi:UDP-N-acetylmuramoylalanine--D-glutamate ligase
MDCAHLFKGKKITMLGLGLLGRGVGDAEFLAGCGAELVVTDRKTEEQLKESVEKLRQYPNIVFHLSGHRIEDFTSCDMVLKAAGVPLDSPEVAAARAARIPVVMSTALFAKLAADEGAIIVGVTGTRGKSTISHMIYHALKNGSKTAFLGGNVRGVSTLSMLPQVKKGDIAVLELDSWQLQGFGDLRYSPHVAVFSNLMPDHQNYYKDMEEYFADKAQIFAHQKPNDFLFVGTSIAERIKTMAPQTVPQVPPLIPADWKLKIVGEHNRENASLAAAALRALGLSEHDIRAGIESFEPVEGRLQFVREVNGVKIYNDNNATTPEATIAALRALGTNVMLICGGSEKGLPLDELVSEIQKRVSHVILLSHPQYKGSARCAEALAKAGVAFEEAANLEQALEAALSHTEKGTILFSPAFASFGMFQNEYERNDQFLVLARALQ